ncbi:hypothetical protein BsLM_0564 [Bacillus sp. LM 4-2]|nr:hypothetical protein BsLM_0564 [Bacillus sp. LM 4-2]
MINKVITQEMIRRAYIEHSYFFVQFYRRKKWQVKENK